MLLGRDDFIVAMLRKHAANSSRKWRIMIKNAKMDKSHLSLSTYKNCISKYFHFWMNVAESPSFTRKGIAKNFVSGSKPGVFLEEM